jgi:3-deoxy-D-manno-octulosonic-acid transferase
VEALRAGGRDVFLSTTTVTGRSVLQRVLPDVPVGLAPLDHPWCVDAALSKLKPSALVLVETEIWPVRIAAAARLGLPIVIVSGRISDRSFPRYMRLRRCFSSTMAQIDAVGARSEVDAQRFISLGVPEDRVCVTGDLKLEAPERAASLAPELKAFLADVQTSEESDTTTPSGLRLFVAGSTHAGEEELALRVLEECIAKGWPVALALAPRHPERFEAVATLLREAGKRVTRRSALSSESETARLQAGEVLLLDSVGELTAVYGRGSLAFVGGSLIPRGGHNVLEPLFEGCPVVFGPHMESAREAAELVCSLGAGEQVDDAASFVQVAVNALEEAPRSRARGEQGRKDLAAHQGSAARSAALVIRQLAAKEASQ